MTSHKQFETLHGHTVFSDGILTHKEVLDLCSEHSIGTIAFTDHEALLDEEKFRELTLLNHDVKFISGVELTFNSLNGMGIPANESGHLIGLFVDPTNRALVDYCRQAQQTRIDKIMESIKSLKGIGFDITIDDVAREVKGLSYAKPHLVAALIKKETNLKLIDSVMENVKNDEARYALISSHDITRRVYDLFLGNDPFMPLERTEMSDNIDFDFVVKLIRDAGGVASIAHWFTIQTAIDLTTLSSLITSKRLDGFETRYGFYDPPEMQKDLVEQMNTLIKLSEQLDCITTGGVDLHKPADLKNLVSSDFARRAHSTVGMTEQLLQKRPDLSLKWTTLK